MKLFELDNAVADLLGYDKDQVVVTVHTGGDNWETVVGIDYCSECKAIHIQTEAKMSKPDPNNKDNKAPTTGSNKSNDNKATETGKPVDPNRPKSD